MAVWVVRAGREGEREEVALGQNLAVIGWEELPDLSNIPSDDLEALMGDTYSAEKRNTIINWFRQVRAFRDHIKKDDLVILPLKTRSAIAIGRVTGPYQYRQDIPNVRHTRPVQWLRKDIPRSEFDQDLLYSFGAFMTVCQIQRNQAEVRIRAMLNERSTSHTPSTIANGATSDREATTDTRALVNLEESAGDQIRTYIGQKFRGHNLARLVTALLKAQGYQTQTAPPGADGGVDIIAGRGPMGFDPPRLCVQVKSSDNPIDVGTLRELQGSMRNFGAEQGLLVSWGGFRQSVVNEARLHFFEIRLWDAASLVEVLLTQYDHLPPDLQAELPLKRIWTLVLEE